ncbi:MAG: efflux RND transporter periplasmic adaptor subunit [Acidithiobacillus sp.]
MTLRSIGRFLLTLAITALAIWLGYILWQRYLNTPWTRDGVVRAHIVDIAADVPGRVVELAVHDNETVKKGQLLFRIDPDRYALVIRHAEAQLASAQVTLALRREQAKRRANLGPDIVASEHNEDAALAEKAAEAVYAQDRAALALARLNLQRTRVLAPVDGVITNLILRQGDYATTGVPRIALVASHSFWIYGYFEQTRLAHIRVGDPVDITLLGQRPIIKGRVEGISAAIADRESSESDRLIANVRPAFNWVRLAARIPVRIKLTHIPKNVQIAAGMIGTVVVKPNR